MLNKVKYGAIIAAVLMVVKAFLPNMEIPPGLQEAIVLIVVFIAQFFIPENEGTRAKLKVR